ncbi:hypothetical protein [Barnesiella intestinihominis]|uniref:hypothetical protein n=1 Tax=Barnesiella intestinihominis TaxID=487174 RepID=UPI00356A7197
MKKNYLFTLAALLLGSTIANAQKPLDGYEEPTFPKDGNVGNIVSFSTSGALEDLENISIPKTPNGKIAQNPTSCETNWKILNRLARTSKP